MPFFVGITLIGLGGLLVWGGLSGRLAKMVAALFPSGSGAQTTAFTAPNTGFQQLALNGGGVLA